MTKPQKCKLLNLMENSTHLLGAHILVPNMLTYHKKKIMKYFVFLHLLDTFNYVLNLHSSKIH